MDGILLIWFDAFIREMAYHTHTNRERERERDIKFLNELNVNNNIFFASSKTKTNKQTKKISHQFT